jgi:hypothetical protein
MTADYTKELLSQSVNGRQIKIAATATPGTLIHTAHATAKDEIWLWAANSDTSNRKVTLEWGGVTVPDDIMEVTVLAEDGWQLIAPGTILTGGVALRMFAALADVVTVGGYVNRIT